jgi:tRNA(adenine34) deaminase
MEEALGQAERARQAGEVPVGAVLVREGRLLAGAHNSPISRMDPTAHAEILALRAAAAAVGNYRLPGTTLYVTLEPCLMCAGAMVHARIGRLVFGAVDPKGGAVVSLGRILEEPRLNHAVTVTGGILRERCAEILSGFFREKRLIGTL